MNKEKEALLQNLKQEVDTVRNKIEEARGSLQDLQNKSIEKIHELKIEDQMMMLEMKAHATARLSELEQLHGSPYFTRCDIVYEKSGQSSKEKKTIYFAKHQFSEEHIYSWIAPISSIRFETPGEITYTLPDGKKVKAVLEHKEQYMIVDGKVLFFATEGVGKPRDLIYQEHFSSRKNGFVLPEIVALMEKAQDQVIRAHHVGPFVISGPAGSGKTTLALHRVGYLVQAPDTSTLYKPKTIIVFVQDTGTKEYFSHLLPELGITDVKITTFSEWTMEVLGMKDAHFVVRPGENEKEKDILEYEKITALRRSAALPRYSANHESVLAKTYEKHLSKKSAALFAEQMKQNAFDRIDLTLLLTSYFQHNDGLYITEEYFTPAKNKGTSRTKKNSLGKEHDGLIKKTRYIPVEYSLIVVDEFQNYMPEQLTVFKKILNEKSKSVIYVGDMAQQVALGTIREWKHVGDDIAPERKVILQKVYRNTKQILRFINQLGYNVTIPEGLKEGPEVSCKLCTELSEETHYIKKVIEGKGKRGTSMTFGILTKNSEQQADLKRMFKDVNNVHISTIAEAQGVEFDVVILAGIHNGIFDVASDIPDALQAEKKRIEKDLLYVGLTRAIEELHVVGSADLEQLSKSAFYSKL